MGIEHEHPVDAMLRKNAREVGRLALKWRLSGRTGADRHETRTRFELFKQRLDSAINAYLDSIAD